MKRKTIYFCVAVLTFITGAIFVSVIVERQQPVVEVEIHNLIEPLPALNPTDFVTPQKNSPQKSRYLEAIEIAQFDPEFVIDETSFQDLSDKPIDFDLDLGHTIENQIIALHPYPDDSREFKIEQQFETSMTVSEEGPHTDLIGWKHYTSDWKEIKRLEGNRFLTSKINESDQERFPKVTSKEIRNVILKAGGKSLADYARSCKTPRDYPCSVALSRISFRILAKENGKWNIIHKINVFVPMGC